MVAPDCMPEEELRKGFAQGRRICQEEWANPDEIARLDRLEAEGVCTLTPWEYSDNFQCERRYATGVVPVPAGKSA